MTTKVHILNFGPDRVDIVLLDGDGKETGVTAPVATLFPQMSADVYLHSGQQVKLVEIKP